MRRNSPNEGYIEAIKENLEEEVPVPEKYDGDISRVISTGSTLLDLEIMGKRVRGGGIPGGILVEIYGPNSGGKTVLMSEIAGGIQRQKGKVKFFDAEARLSKKFAEIFDFTVDDCEFGVPNQVADVFLPLMTWNPDGPPCIGQYNRRQKKCRECGDSDTCSDFDLDNRPINGVFIDSFAQLCGELEKGDEEIDKRGSARAKEFSQWMRKLAPKITANKWLIVGSNQIRDNQKAKTDFDPKYVTPGGNAVPHAASLRLEISPAARLRDEKTINGKKVYVEYGHCSRVKIIKNTVSGQKGSAEIQIVVDYGIDDITANLQYLKKFTPGSKYWTGDNSLEDAIETIEQDRLELELKEAVIDLWEEIQDKFKKDRKPKRR